MITKLTNENFNHLVRKNVLARGKYIYHNGSHSVVDKITSCSIYLTGVLYHSKTIYKYDLEWRMYDCYIVDSLAELTQLTLSE